MPITVLIQPTPGEIAAATAAGILALALADRLYDIGEDALEKEYEIRDRIFEILKLYIDEWQLKDYPQKNMVSDTIYSLSAPVANYGSVQAFMVNMSDDLGQEAVNSISILADKNRNNCFDRECRTEAEMMIPILAGQASNYVYRHQERRRYDLDNHYRKLASLTDRGLEVNPDQALTLLANASTLYGTIGGAAMQAASSAANAAGTFFGYAGGRIGIE